MKYLYLIIRHFFPKKPISRWTIKNEVLVYGSDSYNGELSKLPIATKYVLQDQFGNIKIERTDK